MSKYLFAIALLLLAAGCSKQPMEFNESQTDPTFVGSQQCVSCHQKEYELWQGSHKNASHALVDRVMTKLDRQLSENNGHVALGRRTIADPYAFAMSRWADYLPKKISAYANIQAFHERMKNDPGVVAALAAHGISK